VIPSEWLPVFQITIPIVSVLLINYWLITRYGKQPADLIDQCRKLTEQGEFRRGIVNRKSLRLHTDEVELTCGHKAETGTSNWEREKGVVDCWRCGERWIKQEKRRRWMRRLSRH
jgi:hypothetical protein